MWECPTPQAMRALASRLAAFVGRRDFIAFEGDLGAGKTVFAQGLLAALGVTGAVTSPTYQIVHAYEANGRRFYHCDFFRLALGDLEEIGFSEMRETGVILAEWAENIGHALPADRLEVHIATVGEGNIRRVEFKGTGAWADRLERFRAVSEFLDTHGWGNAECTTIIGDASIRQFCRLKQNGRTVMLMDWPVRPDGPPIRGGLPYSRIAHLAENGRSFLALSRWLHEKAGVSAPEVFAFDVERGFYLVTDLGDDVFGRLIGKGSAIEPLYALAVDGLLAIRRANPPSSFELPFGESYALPRYDRQALEVELELLIEWYFKLATGRVCPSAVAGSFAEAWSPLLDWLEQAERALVLRDYHSPNLILRADAEGLSKLGVIDFQDAVLGHPAYDLVSLLQDARLDVPEAAERTLFERYTRGARSLDPAFDASSFAKGYAILGAQRNTKILGIFARLSQRDGKHDYLAHLPRVRRYLFRNLAHEELKPLQSWYNLHLRLVPSEALDVRKRAARGVA